MNGNWPDALYPTGHGQLGKDGQMARGGLVTGRQPSAEETPALDQEQDHEQDGAESKSAVAPCSEAHGAVSG